jgi:hypothetical protein
MTRTEKDYALGYRHGSDSTEPDSRDAWDREAYFSGYTKGSEDRDTRLSNGEGHVPRPDWMTDAQFEAVNKLYRRSADGAKDRHAFFTRIQQHGFGSDKYAGLTWCGMFVGIEPDGHAHT